MTTTPTARPAGLLATGYSAGPIGLVRLYLRSELALPLIHGVVRPATTGDGEQAQQLDQLHFHLRRHWLGGPHIQFGWVRPATDRHHQDPPVPNCVAELVGQARQWLGSRLSNGAPGSYPRADQWLETSHSLGRQELVEPPYSPIYDEGQVVEVADERLLATQLGGESVRLMRARALSRIGREVLRRAPNPDADRSKRLASAMGILIAMASAYPTGGLANGYLSLRSHAEDYLFDHDRDGAARSRWQPIIERLAHAAMVPVRGHLETGQRNVDQGTGNEPGHRPEGNEVDGLDLAVIDALAEATELARNGEIHVLLPWAYVDRAATFDDDLRRKWRAGDDRSYSEFHSMLRELDFDDPIEGQRFAAYRHVTAITYEQLGLIGISPAERVICSLAVSDAVERCTGSSWQDIFRKGME